MEHLDFDFHSMRAAKARIGAKIGGANRRWLIASISGLVTAGIGLVVISLPLGWLLIGCAAIPMMIVMWYDGELRHLPSDKHEDSLDDILSGDVLGRLPENPTPSDIAMAVGSVPSGQFFSVRFGITPRMIDELGMAESVTTESVWRHALMLRQEAGHDRISAPILVMALLRSIPQYETILAHLHLSESDIIRGIEWHTHLRQLVEESRAPRRTGGIARDWAFGFTPLLARFGQNISEQLMRGRLSTTHLETHTDVLDQLLRTFGSGGKQNVTIIGPVGAGKTTIVHAFAETLLDARAKLPESLRFRQVVMLDASALISAAPGRGDLEGLMTQLMNEAYRAKNIILCLDNAQMFFREGTGSVDLSSVLLPILEAGNLRMILTMDEQSYLELNSRNPTLGNALNRVSVVPADEAETLRVMQDTIIVTEFRRHVTYTYQALKEAYRLSERYVYDLAMPGRALKLVEAAAGYAENGLVTINSVQQAVEKTMNVKVAVASEVSEREVLLNLEQLIHERMVNQSRAVQVVSDALRRARTGVRNQNRPIGTFLFLGPTGVGKTELAKALAEVYFDGEDRIIRLDLNEYVRPEDVSRLIADGARDPYSLTAQIMKQPFSVVLLDEIEKAHPGVLATLLQLLDEGILRDERNREVSFRDAIVIATSNAGAERIREYIDRGHQLEQFEKPFIDELISSGQFRPEFLNRFDEIVLFRPLDKSELVQVVQLIIAGINKTLAPQHVSVELVGPTIDMLVDAGYDPRLGARPMRRIVQQVVENTIAKIMLKGEAAPGSVIQITPEHVREVVPQSTE